ncbi:MAG: D-aminoacyl-tRNA deacylase [Dehalococcoidia bacterium]|nr:D-aminoacyl-tRNA deacylase [Dehalococcoidia bacterium]
MRALLQRVSAAAVSVDGEEVGRIGLGLCILVGIAVDDLEEDAGYLVNKVLNLRIFPDEVGKFNRSLLDIRGEILLVSQFTLFADTSRGRRPSFVEAAPAIEAARLFNHFVTLVRASGLVVATGIFGKHMHLEIHNDGPVTIMLGSQST